MSIRSLYPIFDDPVRTEKVSNGLWKIVEARPQTGSLEDEYFRSVAIFARPMVVSNHMVDLDLETTAGAE